MTRGEKRVIGQLLIEKDDKGEFLSVGVLHMILGYSRAFVERTCLKLYWNPPKGLALIRMYDSEREDWFYRIERKWLHETRGKETGQ